MKQIIEVMSFGATHNRITTLWVLENQRPVSIKWVSFFLCSGRIVSRRRPTKLETKTRRFPKKEREKEISEIIAVVLNRCFVAKLTAVHIYSIKKKLSQYLNIKC